MAKKNFYDLVRKTAEELKSKQFSNSLFTEIFTAYLNTPEVVTEEYKNGELVATHKPVQEFRGFLKDMLVEYGADAEDASRFVEEYEFTEKAVAKFARPLVDGALKGYMKTGKTFKFIPEEDFEASLSIVDVEPFTKNYRGNYGEVKVDYDQHKKLVRHSGAPTWKRNKTKIK